MNFWQKLKKPFFCLAPMADVTDCAFRKIIAKYGKPDVFWTEFVSADGLVHPKAQPKLLIDLKYDEEEHPIVAQIFGSNLENLENTAKLISDLGFDGIDINMGCPDKAIEKQRSGAACIKDPTNAKQIIRAVKQGIKSSGRQIPVSVKTRLGYNKNEMDTWVPNLLEEDIQALTMHLRTRKEMSTTNAHWEVMPQIIKIRNQINPNTLIIGNGDVLDIEDAKEKAKTYGCDGVMLGRAIFGNPWLFSNKKDIPTKVRLTAMLEHTKEFDRMLGGTSVGGKNFAIMKKHFKSYVNDFSGAKELRIRLMETQNVNEVEEVVNSFLQEI